MDGILGFRINKFLNFSADLSTKEEEKREKVIIWTGRAQPWHRGHDAMIQKGKQYFSETGATKILIMIVKGGATSQNKDENPLNEQQQVELIYSLYRNDPQVQVYNKFPKNSFIGDIMDHVTTTGYVVVGWLAGSDRFSDYNKSLKSFNPTKFRESHLYSPILFNQSGIPQVSMIETPRLMSGTKSRQLTKEVDFKTWIAEVAPSQTDDVAARVYYSIYNIIRNENLKETVQLNEITAFHGSSEDIQQFDLNKSKEFGIHFGSKESAKHRSNNQIIKQYDLTINKALELDDVIRWAPENIIPNMVKNGYLTSEQGKEILQNNTKTAIKISKENGSLLTKEKNNVLLKQLQALGYDGIKYDNRGEAQGPAYIIFDPNQAVQIKTDIEEISGAGGRRFFIN